MKQCSILSVIKIQRCLRLWLCRTKNLQIVRYKKTYIHFSDINFFEHNSRNNNDKFNKKREDILCCLFNKKIPIEFFNLSLRWKNLSVQIDLFLDKLCYIENINYENLLCTHNGGRSKKFDFTLLFDKNIKIYIEFKYNAISLPNIPQFVSPMKPSHFFNYCYEFFYFENYLKDILVEFDIDISKNDYYKQIHQTSPKFIKPLQTKYYNGCKNSSKYTGCYEDINFYEKMKKISKQSINDFIEKYDINIDYLNDYIQKTQKNKTFMLFKKNCIHLETFELNDLNIVKIIKEPSLNRYIAITNSKNNIKILLRWKNGNGIAFPSLQISL